MIKKQKNVAKKEKTNNKPLKETKQKTKDFQDKNKISSKNELKTLTCAKKQYNKNIKIHNSISSKEEVKRKNSPKNGMNKQIKQNVMNNNNINRLLSSNAFFETNDIENNGKENDKKIKKNYKKNYSNCDKINSHHLNDLFKKNYLKQTIIIDDEGNNNLNLNLENIDKNDYKNILNLNNNKLNYNNKIELNNSVSFSANTETNSLFENTNNYNSNIYKTINKENDIKQTIIDKNEEERRLKEYNRIFNLLNSNIEQFKKMFNSSNIKTDNNNK